MSKHFELIEQMEKQRSSGAGSLQGTAGAFPYRRPTTVGEPGWSGDESLRLVQQVFFSQKQESPRVVVFAGIDDDGGGCSRICAAVAATLATNTRRPVCLVEGNFRSPAEGFGGAKHHGLAEALVSKEPIAAFAKLVKGDNLWLLSAGALTADSPSLLASDEFRARVDELRGQFEFVIIDAPPLAPYSDAVVLGRSADGVVLVLEAGATRREPALAAAENLRTLGIPILAAVLDHYSLPMPEKLYNKL
jgi:Mrp family chromosome partitioning ATPase